MQDGHFLIWTYMKCFDHRQNGFGVGEYLKLVNRRPDGFTILVCHPDFIHLHQGMAAEYTIPPDMCGDRGDPRKLSDADRERLSWTNYQFRDLVDEIHRFGCKVYLSVFGSYQYDLFHREWLSDHQELRLQNSEGTYELNALKRLEDGTFYEDFFRQKLVEVMQDFHLDGIHLCDLFCPLPNPLADCDYSTDMYEQFLSHTGIKPAPNIRHTLGDDGTAARNLRKRWTWLHHRADWIRFYDWRWTGFFKKICSAMHAIGCEVSTLGMYVSDPFQSKYYMGLDVRHLAEAGVDYFTANVVATGCNMNNPAREPKFHRYMTIIPLMKALIPNTRLYQMLGIRDDAEEWDVLHHAPNQFERDVYTGLSYQLITGRGINRCIEMPFMTLGDSIDANDWQITNRYLDTAYSLKPDKVLSPVLYWSDSAFDAFLDVYIRTRRPSDAKLTAILEENGAFCGGVVRSEDLDAHDGPLFIPTFDLLPPSEIERLLSGNQPILAMAAADYVLPSGSASVCIRDRFSTVPLQAFLLNVPAPTDMKPYEELLAADDGTPNLSQDVMALDDNREIQDNEMLFAKVTAGFAKACAMLFVHMDSVCNLFRANVPLTVYRQKNGSYRLNLYNRYEGSYDLALVKSGRQIDDVQILSSFPYLKVKFVDEVTDAYADIVTMARSQDASSQKAFQVKIRPADTAVLELRLKDE
ncbi:MAG: hypothetical protein E7463_04805 [Ruminococcaceae bacterium]|nr:hypothetical protein [Oscillospiraceae bacterium]